MFFPPSSLYEICLYTHFSVGVAQWILLFKRNLSLTNMIIMMIMNILCDALFLLLSGLFFKEKYNFWASQNFAVNIHCSFFPEFLLFFPVMLQFLNSHPTRWYLWAIFTHAFVMAILFYGLAGSRCQGLSGGELRG